MRSHVQENNASPSAGNCGILGNANGHRLPGRAGGRGPPGRGRGNRACRAGWATGARGQAGPRGTMSPAGAVGVSGEAGPAGTPGLQESAGSPALRDPGFFCPRARLHPAVAPRLRYGRLERRPFSRRELLGHPGRLSSPVPRQHPGRKLRRQLNPRAPLLRRRRKRQRCRAGNLRRGARRYCPA